MVEPISDSAIAIIGMAGRFPGAASPDELWANLADGHIAIRPVTAEELAAAGVDAAEAHDPRYVRRAAPLDGIEMFDAAFFGFSPREAELTDPQHRLFLECCWEAIEQAGYQPNAVPGAVGVFGGCGISTYLLNNLIGTDGVAGAERVQYAVGNDRDALATLVSYKLGLRGPSVTVQTFCSTSLVAVHLACQSLLTFESDVALAGGVAVEVPQPTGYRYEEGGILSPDGVVRSFDAGANGSVVGNGVAVVLLKRHADARRDGDFVHAVILGSAMNNDGRAKAGFTAPGTDGQASAIADALAVAGVSGDTIDYVECHATGTMLGDSVELAAMQRALPAPRERPCVLGSLKPSVGHLDRASGVSGLVRAALALRHRVQPGTPNYEAPNPALAASRESFTVLPSARHWERYGHPRRAGVSSFGLGGTNVHAVLQEADDQPAGLDPGQPQLLVLSARSQEALQQAADRLAQWLDGGPDPDNPGSLADVAWTLQWSRAAMPVRLAIVVHDRQDAVDALRDTRRWLTAATHRRDATVALRLVGCASTSWWARLAETAGSQSTTPHEVVAAVAAGMGASITVTESKEAVEVPVEDAYPVAVWRLTLAARLWLVGVPLDFAVLHDGPRRRVPLPTYPFERRRYWADPTGSRRATSREPILSATPEATDDLAGWFSVPSWRQRPLPHSGWRRPAGEWAIVGSSELAHGIGEELRQAGVATSLYGTAADFAADGAAPKPRTVVLVGDSGGSMTGAGGEPTVFCDALAVVAAMVGGGGCQGDLFFITRGAVSVSGEKVVDPGAAALFGLAPVVTQENPGLGCRVLDVVSDVPAARVVAELCEPERSFTAIRGEGHWLRTYEPVRLEKPPTPSDVIPDGAAVLITGGIGDVGTVLAEHLWATRRCRLAITSRSPVPPEQEWGSWMAADGGEEDRVAANIRRLQSLSAKGVPFLALSVDVSDEASLAAAVAQVDAAYGSVDVVIHAAGVSDPRWFGLAHQVGLAECRPHFDAKVAGFLNLERVLATRPDTRRIAVSSLSSVLGGIGFAAYAGSNAALDALVAATPDWTTVDWEGWQVRRERHVLPGTTIQALRMSREQGVDAFERTLAAGLRHVVVSSAALGDRLAAWVDRVGVDDGAATDSVIRHPRPALSTGYAAPAAGLEATVARAWCDVLGVIEVGAVDDFFELGGHSLLAVRLATRLQAVLGRPVPLATVLEHPTVAGFAAAIAQGHSVGLVDDVEASPLCPTSL